ncbi:hypothetical protein HDU77_002882 [Chytriomyces hyalinus]|nr:hypothetical protein HDU77_002882 [Chytriomyces hyalinus]
MDQQIGFPRAVSDEFQSILSEQSRTNWAIFGYDRMSNDLKVIESGDGGLDELAEEWDDSKILYAVARVVEPISNLPKTVFISWCGDGVPVAKKGLFHHHVNDAVKFFKGFHVHINARSEIDVTPDAIMKKIKDSSGAKYSIHNEGAKKAAPVAPVGASYTPVQTAPKPFVSTPAAFNKPTSSYTPPAFNKPAVQASPAVFNRPALSPSYGSAPSTQFNKPVASPSTASAPAVSRFAPAPYSPSTPVAVAAPAPVIPSTGINAKAIFTYTPQEANELSFNEGDIITAIEKVDEGWWQGKNPAGVVGLFPMNYVEEITQAAPAPAPAPAPVLFNRPSVSHNQQQQPALFNRPAATPTSPTYMSNAANKWLGDDDTAEPKAKSGYAATFASMSIPGEDKVAAEKERREREDRELRERAEAESRAREARERKEAEEREEKQRAAALSAAAAPPAPAFAAAPFGVSARAMYAYDAQEDNEITFAEGELITAIEKLDEGWWQGTNGAGRVGLFPAAYVEEVSGAAQPAAQAYEAPAPAHEAYVPEVPAPQADEGHIEAIALYDYVATEENEVSFSAGDRITNVVFISDDWWQGRVGGIDGLFPGNYVEVQK